MDGNGRWAEAQGLDRSVGHVKGAETLRNVIIAALENSVRYLTVYGFSTENWKRPLQEVGTIFSIFQDYLKNETTRLHEEGVCLRILGDKTRFSSSLQDLIQWAQDLTVDNDRLGLQVAMNYGSRLEIVSAVKVLAEKCTKQEMGVDDITCEAFSRVLETAPWPDPDLLIRTGGEVRLSNYLLWQLSYSELLFLDTYWPDFTKEHLAQAISTYQQRHRRYGNLL
ncbi:isoprenyl transferase [Holospora undulata HU1]|uniref:Isoprenyl transferase n=3 Tax=Holosporaceae TaxID=44746 RepID=A0A061JFY4_9PROT|nr:isoprenyl transferase [Holospora undulata HU1]GAJ46418.1 isoprenyl transferase [Holospora elegans E1]